MPVASTEPEATEGMICRRATVSVEESKSANVFVICDEADNEDELLEAGGNCCVTLMFVTESVISLTGGCAPIPQDQMILKGEQVSSSVEDKSNAR